MHTLDALDGLGHKCLIELQEEIEVLYLAEGEFDRLEVEYLVVYVIQLLVIHESLVELNYYAFPFLVLEFEEF